MELKQNANRCVILLHEIYGINNHMHYYANLLFQEKFDVYVPNFLPIDRVFTYEEEEIAYQHFIEQIGFEKAHHQISLLIHDLSKTYNEIHLIGFSIGATVAWLCSNHPDVKKVIGFYGSRIRQYTELQPLADVTLIYGKQEKSFVPEDLQRSLSIYPNVDFMIVDGEHGFADPYSAKYKKTITDSLLARMLG